MAHNAASHNAAGIPTTSATQDPPPTSSETKSAVLEAAKNEATGQHVAGQNQENTGKKVKTEKELEKERQKAEKLKKFEAKKAKQQQPSNGESASQPKAKEKKQVENKPDPATDYVEETPVGEKKILKPLDDAYHKAYIPRVVESAWYDWWEKQGYFQPEFGPDGEVKKNGSFVICIPPPNVTGALHCGHAIATALQDVLIRWHRMRGFTTLYVPGCDHAGIATQSVVENMLWRRRGQTRYDLGRENFISTVQDWKEEYHQKMNRVIKRLGASVDWTREAFTMSPELSAAVLETFVRLHEEGFIYRSNRLVNWCTKLNTALSSVEVDNKEIEGRTLLDVPGYDRKVEFGVITHFKYPLNGSDEFIEVATTRPETMLGDTGIAVNPKDPRYTHLVGKKARHPFIADRILPIVADDYVDIDFGTGAVKLTPAHDVNDFNLGKKHNLQFINILNDNGTLNENTGIFEGQRRFDARYTVVEELTKLGLFVKKENNKMKIPLCSRSKDVVEPIMKPQWWMRMKELAEPAAEVVRDGTIKIRPESAEKTYFSWLNNINDWCLSRQLWWGHQIPAYRVIFSQPQPQVSEEESWVVARTETEAQAKAQKKFPDLKFTLERDADVLDTWFSSGLWPFSTLGWPNETNDYTKLYPTSVLETGWDILFFWVIRMIIFGIKLTGKIPFKEVYCHSLIRDSEGRKMSKSLGNVIDPIDILDGVSLQTLHEKLHTGNLDPKEVKSAEKYQKTAFPQGIPECGSDALRFSLVQYTTGGGDINFDVKVMAAYRRFCNKIYQATKYALGNIDQDFKPREIRAITGKESLAERWILHKFTRAAKDVHDSLTAREFSRSTQIIYRFWYDHLCDVYIENSKSIIQDGTPEQKRSAIDTLYTAVEGALTMIHPFMPFLSEELWQRLPRRTGDNTASIVIAQYPTYEPSFDDTKSEAAYELILGCSSGVRSLLSQYDIKDEGHAYVQALDETSYATASAQQADIRSLCGKLLNSLTVLGPNDAKPQGCAVFPVSAHASVFVHVKGIIDIDKEIIKAQTKLDRALDGVQKQKKIVERADGTASAAVVEQEQKKLTDFEAEVLALEEAIQQFHALKLES